MADEYESSKNSIERDLASFADPGTRVEISKAGRNFRAAWTARDTHREALFSAAPDGRISVRTGDGNLPYHSFVAGSGLADLRAVARMILQALEQPLSIETRAECDDPEYAPSESGGPAVSLLEALLDRESDADAATRVIMLTGDAGAGKTHILRELVRRQADKYVRGQTTQLLLYVNAQGRALARLNEALATELQDLKVGLTYHSIAVLARLGILVPVIDGFDELLGVSGYDDAFSSLASFLEQLEGRGQLLVSARSVYYEEEFLSRADDGNQPWEHIPVRVLDWEEGDRRNYLDQWGVREHLSEESTATLRKRIREVFGGDNHDLASKPLFFTWVVNLLNRDPEFSSGGDLLRQLADDYLFRERNEKLLDRQSGHLLAEKQIERLMCELAEEMWNQDTRALDYRSVREVAEYVVMDPEEGLSEAAQRTVIERIPTLAFLSRGGDTGPGTGAFEHEMFFFYFLGKTIAKQLASAEGDMRITLSRSALPEDVAIRVARELSAEGLDLQGRLQELLARLVEAGRTEWRRTMQVRENAGLLVMALFRACREVEGCAVDSVVFPGSDLSEVHLIRCTFRDVTVRRTDLRSTKFTDCAAEKMIFFEPLVRPDVTRLELKGIEVDQVAGIRVVGEEANYDPSIIEQVLQGCGTPLVSTVSRVVPDAKVGSEYRELVERLMRLYRRANPVFMDEDQLPNLFRNPAWPTVQRLFVEHKLVEEERRQKSGRPTVALRRRFLPEKLMSGLNANADVDPRIRAFWRALASEASN